MLLFASSTHQLKNLIQNDFFDKFYFLFSSSLTIICLWPFFKWEKRKGEKMGGR